MSAFRKDILKLPVHWKLIYNRTGRKIHHPKCITKTISYILALGHLGIHKDAGIYQSVQTIDIAAGLPFICG